MFTLFSAFASSAPFLLFDKKVEREEAKVGAPIHVTYTIANLGDSPATDLSIEDCAIPIQQWEVPSAASNLKWNEIQPGEVITHVFTVKPLIEGSLHMESTRLDYLADGSKKIAISSQVYFFEASSTRSIGSAANLKNYTFVLLAAFATIVLPFLLWILVKPTQKKAAGKSKSE